MKRFVLLLLALPTPIGAQAVLSGHVRTADGDQPLAEVEVSLPALERRALTKADGSFAFSDLPPGVLRIVVRRIGYEPIDMAKQIPSAGTLKLEFRMIARGAVLDSIYVTAELDRRRVRMAEFEQRRRVGIGTFLTQKQLERRETLSLQTLLRE